MARPLIPFVQNGYYASRNWIPLVKGNGFTTSGGGEQEEVWETASGSIVTFDAVAAPLRQLSVAVEPVQNLNGYDNPWPAGGGKNKLDSSFCLNRTAKGIKSVVNADGSITLTGTSDGTARYWNSSDTLGLVLPVGTYTLSEHLRLEISGGALYSGTFSLLEETTFQNVQIVGFSNGETVNVTLYPQLEAGPTATAYAPYSNICPISGWTGATVTRTGKNLLPPQEITGGMSNVQVSSNGDKVTINGTASAYGQVISANTLTLDAGTYFLEIFVVSGSVTNGSVPLQLRSVNGTTIYVNTATGASFTLQERTELKFRVTYGSGAVISNYIIQPMIVSGSTAPTAYEPYQGNEYTIQLGETVYGGTLDVVNGKMTVDKVAITIDGVNVRANSSDKYGQNTRANILYQTGFKAKYDGASTFCISDKLHASYKGVITSYEDVIAGDVRVFPHSFALLVNFPPSFGVTNTQTANEWFAANTPMVCYPLATPFELTLTPEQISTLQGTNNVWSDAGDVTVEYRAQ